MTLTATETKWISMFAVGFGSFVIGVIPTCFLSRDRDISNKLVISALLCFGGGVLLATSVLHMLPETRDLLPNYAEFVFCCGFLLLYLVDEIVHYLWINNDEHGTTNNHNHTHNSNHNRPIQRISKRNEKNERGSSTCVHHVSSPMKLSHPKRYQDDDESNRDGIYEIPCNDGSRNLTVSSSSTQDEITSLSYETTTTLDTIPNAIGITDNNKTSSVPKVTQYGSCCGEDETFLCLEQDRPEPCPNNSNTGHLGLLLALTLHALLEGLAIGLQRASSEVLLLVGAVVSHKFVVAFCFGLELAGSTSKMLKNVLAIGLFSGGSVLGIGMGMLAVKMEGSLSKVVMPILQGLAGGTLLYVTVSEVLPRERARWHGKGRNHRSAGLIQFFSVLLGFGVIYTLNHYLASHHEPSQ